jgi:hypothetical protein
VTSSHSTDWTPNFDAEDLYQLLNRVGSGLVVMHTSSEPNPGWSWSQAAMSLPFQEMCARAFHDHLIDLGMHQPWGSPASLSPEGSLRLAELRQWHLQHAGGVA